MIWSTELQKQPKNNFKLADEQKEIEEFISKCNTDYVVYNPICPSPKSEEQERIMTKKFDQFIYLDNNATTPLLPTVKEKINAVADMVGNGSSDHEAGIKVRAYVEQARINVAQKLKVDPKQLLFTSSGSESNNMVIKGFVLKNIKTLRNSRILTTEYEHKSVLNSINYIAKKFGCIVDYLSLDKNGAVDVDKVLTMVKNYTKETNPIAMVSVIGANNETGVINPVRKIISIFKNLDERIFTHSDMCQLLGKAHLYPLDYLDAATFTAHKFGGPIGVSALYLKDFDKIDPLIHGGNQEFQMRAGTYNAPLIFGMSAAVLEISTNNMSKMILLRDEFIKNLKNNFDCKINCEGALRLSNTISVTFNTSILAEKMVQKLSKAGIFISTSSACNSREKKPSYVLKAIGLSDEEAYRTLRISLNINSTQKELNILLTELKQIIGA